MKQNKILEKKSVKQAMNVATYFSDSILTPAVKIFNSSEHWGMKNIVLSPISLVVLVLSIPSFVFTSCYLLSQKRPNNSASGSDYDKAQNLKSYINASVNNVCVALVFLAVVISLCFILPWNCIVKPIEKSYSDFVAKNKDPNFPWLLTDECYNINSQELERMKQDTHDPLLVEGSNLFLSNSDAYKNSNTERKEFHI